MFTSSSSTKSSPFSLSSLCLLLLLISSWLFTITTASSHIITHHDDTTENNNIMMIRTTTNDSFLNGYCKNDQQHPNVTCHVPVAWYGHSALTVRYGIVMMKTIILIIIMICLMEISFYLYYHYYMIQKANRIESVQHRFLLSSSNNRHLENGMLNQDFRPISQRRLMLERMIQRTYQLAYMEHYYNSKKRQHDSPHNDNNIDSTMIYQIFQRMTQEYYMGWFYQPHEVPTDLIIKKQGMDNDADDGVVVAHTAAARNAVDGDQTDDHVVPQIIRKNKYHRLRVSSFHSRLLRWKSQLPSLSSISSSSSTSSSSSSSSPDRSPPRKLLDRSDITSTSATNPGSSLLFCSNTTTTNILLSDDDIDSTSIRTDHVDRNDVNGTPAPDDVDHDQPNRIVMKMKANSSSLLSLLQEQQPQPTPTWTIPYICREDADRCYSIGFFQKYWYDDLDDDEKQELEYCYHILQRCTGLVFHPKRKLLLPDVTSSSSTTTTGVSTGTSHHVDVVDNDDDEGQIDSDNDDRNNSNNDNKNDNNDNDTNGDYCLPRQLQFEKVTSLHRPLLFYLWIQLIQYVFCYVILRYVFGFKRIYSKQKNATLYGWYYQTKSPTSSMSSPKTKSNEKKSNVSQPKHKVYIFFHGVAPGGLVLYLPMLLLGLFRDMVTNRFANKDITKKKDENSNSKNTNEEEKEEEVVSIFLFENPNISTTLGAYHTLSEIEACHGIYELIHQQLGLSKKKEDNCSGTTTTMGNDNEETSQQNYHTEGTGSDTSNVQLIIIGHSFGTCQVSWMIHSKLFHDMIHTIVLLDPVSLLLSDPDVMINFFYHDDTAKKRRYHKFIRLLGSSELFTQYYLRRHFAWYNSELWLEYDILNSGHNWNILIAVSGNDNIVHATKVKHHIEYLFHHHHQSLNDHLHKQINHENGLHNQNNNENVINDGKKKFIYWENAGHADCAKESRKWDELRFEIQALVHS